jgi:hypothetical protein
VTLGSLLVLGCLSLIIWSSWRWAAVARLPGILDVLVASGVLIYGTIVGTVLLVGGVLHALSPGPLALAAVGTAVLAGATTAGRRQRAQVADARRALWGALHHLWPALRSSLVLVLALTAVVAVGYRLVIAAAFPALDWDGLAYHLPMADYWLQERRILTNPFSFWAQIYPGAAESAVAWLGALTGTVRTAAAVQIGAAALGTIAVVALCRGADCTRRSSLVGGLLFPLAPLVLTQLSTAEVDILAAATLLACWHLALVALRRDRSQPADGPGGRSGPVDLPRDPEPVPVADAGSGTGAVALAAPHVAAVGHPTEAAGGPSSGVLPALVVAGIGAGVAVGVKITNLLGIAVVGIVIVGTTLWRDAVRERRPGQAVRRVAVQAACFGLPTVALGACWYVRNALVWGNPFYPVAVAGLPGNPEVLALTGVDPNQVGTTNRYWAVLVSWASDLHWRTYFYGSPTGGLGALWLVVLAPAVLVAFVLLARSRHRLFAWAFLAPGLLLLAVYPSQHHPRYTLFLLGVGGVALAVVLDRLPRLPRQVLLAVVVAGAVFSASAASWRAPDLSGSVEPGLTPGEVLALLREPADERAAAGLRGAFTDTDRAEAGSTIVVPPEFGDFDQPWVLPHSLWGDDLSRRVIKSAEPIADADQALQALTAYDAEYLVVAKGSPLEAALTGAPGRLHPAFDVGWLARAWAAGPGSAG